jgi:hypothetical protein
MGIGAIEDLRFGHLTSIPKHNLYQIEVYANSKKRRYVSCYTPECRKAVDAYLNIGAASGKHYRRNATNRRVF